MVSFALGVIGKDLDPDFMVQPSQISYRPEVDGLRAVSVIPVILFHAGLSWMQGGFVGVDVFFVISGYLISGIILQKLENQNFSIGAFFEARLRRIAPALIVVTVVTLLVFGTIMLPLDGERLSWSAFFSLVFLSNYYFYETLGYFSPNAEQIPLLHTWSLGVEGQFYLIFPFLLMAIKGIGRPLTTAVLVVAVIAGLVVSEYILRINPSIGFFYFPSRAWELGAGCLLASYERWRPIKPQSMAILNLLSGSGICMIVWAMLTFDKSSAHPGIITLVPVIGSMLVLYATTDGTLTCAILRLRTVVWIGLLSYSAYLWHQPILVFFRMQGGPELSGLDIALILSATLVLSVLSHRYVEVPFRNRGLLPRARFVKSLAAGLVLAFGACYAGIVTNGYETAYIDRLPASEQALYKAVNRAISSDGYGGMQDDGKCRFWSEGVTSETKERFQSCARRLGPAIIVLGDSHGMDLYNAFFYAGVGPVLVGIARPGCRVSENQPHCQFDEMHSFITSNRSNILQIFFTENGSYLLTDERRLPVAADLVEKTRDHLLSLAKAAPTYWLGPQDTPAEPLKLENLAVLAAPPQESDLTPTLAALDEYLMARAAKPQQNLFYVSKRTSVDYRPARDFYLNGEFSFADGEHWSSYGEKLFGVRLVDTLVEQGVIDASHVQH